MKKIILSVILLLLLLPIVFSESKKGHLTLLAVKETDDGFEGSTADLYLEIRPGSGKVFLDTFPLTKVDTQISTRFAKEIACDFLDIECDEFDFVYTIKAESSIIAGPSAGAAAAVLTSALLADLEIDDSVSITGTINSGGLIGPVGGIKQKIDAGASMGLKKILIPKGEKIVGDKIRQTTETVVWDVFNDTLNVVVENRTKTTKKDYTAREYSKRIGIDIKEVSNLNDALYEFTGVRIQENDVNLEIDEKYSKIMRKLSLDLCNRTDKLKLDISKVRFDENLSSEKEEALNLSEKGMVAFDEEKFYSSASYCFGANVKLSFLQLMSKDLSDEDILKAIAIVKENIDKIEGKIVKKEIKTITDLESYASIKERLLDANFYLNLTLEDINNSDAALYSLAYASERVYSALSWYEFFKNLGKSFDLKKEKIKKSCQEKIAEAEERHQYVKLLFPAVDDSKKEIDYAYSYLGRGEYELCLFKASIAKAQADIVLSLVGLDENETMDVLDTKLDIVKRNIVKVNEKDIFPIMAYSYYEYANSLKETDIYSALLYAEYALELGNFNLYFEGTDAKEKASIQIDSRIFIFLLGLVIGLLPYLISRKKKVKKKRKKS